MTTEPREPDAPPHDTAGSPPGTGRTGLLHDARFWNVLCGIVVFVTALYLFGWKIGSYPLSDPWEPRYPQTVREMLDRGDLITPYWEGEIRWAKPILVYWAMMPAVKLFGHNEFSSRLSGVVFASFCVLSVYFCLLRLRGRGTALMGAGVLATTPMYYFLARYCTPDILLASSLGAAMMFFALGRFGERRKTLWYCVSYACLALAFLAKGPVACAIAVGAVLTFWVLDLQPRRLLSRHVFGDLKRLVLDYRMLPGMLVFAAVAGPWYAAILLRHGNEFIDSFIRGENLHRFAEPVRTLEGSSSHYVETVFFGFWPWASLLPPAVLFLCCGWSKVDEARRQIWYFMSWTLTIFLIFTAAGSKLDHYILPLTVPFAIMIALVWEQAFKRPTPYWIRAAFLVSLGFAVLPLRDFLLLGNLHIMDAFTTKREIINMDVDSALLWIHGAWGLAILGVILLTRHARVFAALALAVTLGSTIYFSHHVVPRQGMVRSLKHYVRYYQQTADPGTDLVFFSSKRRHTISYYTGGKDGYVLLRPSLGELVDYASEHDVYIIIENKWSNVVRIRLKRDTDHPWHVLKSENARYDMVCPGEKPETPPDWETIVDGPAVRVTPPASPPPPAPEA